MAMRQTVPGTICSGLKRPVVGMNASSASQRRKALASRTNDQPDELMVLIIGAGFAGLAVAGGLSNKVAYVVCYMPK